MAHQDEGGVREVTAFARAELERVARDLADGREPAVVGEAAAPGAGPGGGPLAALAAARDAELWAAVGAVGAVHE